MLGNFIKLNIIKKIIGIYNARVSAWRLPSYLDKAYMVVIHDGVWSDTLFFYDGVAHVHGGGMVGFRWLIFFNFLSLDLEIHANPFRNWIKSFSYYFYQF